ncbi:hypothetical protein BX666DRAFT_2125176 [Dichotomocladium elegans]|nr:hypothetical protein BX666DRAFT_2125176 [Dichotomocladium elegans]
MTNFLVFFSPFELIFWKHRMVHNLLESRRIQYIKDEARAIKHKAQEVFGNDIALIEASILKHQLLKNPKFKLIHVISNGQPQPEMRIVIPATDEAIRDEVNKQGYYTVSHLWGESENWTPWSNHGIVGPDGKIIEVQIFSGKRAAILSLLSSRPGFWWIDVFCWQDAVPPPIMRYVYRFCEKCFALVDLPSAKFPRIKEVVQRLGNGGTAKPDDERINEIASCYKKCIEVRKYSKNRTWSESLDDLLGGWYKGDREDIKALAEFFGCRWFTRVWTLQEYALPSQLIFISESDLELHQIDRNLTTFILRVLCTVANKVFLSYNWLYVNGERLDVFNSLGTVEEDFEKQKPSSSICHFDLTRLDAIMIHGIYAPVGFLPGVTVTPLRHVSKNYDPLVLLLKKLARMPRTCMHPRDYVYGVTGLLDLKIDVANNDNDVWTNFKKAVLKRAPEIYFDPRFELSQATDLQNVYKMFLGEDPKNYDAVTNLFNKIWD